MGRKYTDNALTTLATNLGIGGTTLTVQAAKGDLYPPVVGHGAPGSAPDYFVITLQDASNNIEKMRVEQRAAGQDILGSAGFPLVRGFDGTTARAWVAGDLVDLRIDRTGISDVDDKAQGANKAFGIRGAATAGLNFGYYGGTILNDGVLTNIADGAVALTASNTNFVERTPAGVVSANIVAFSADKIPLYQVVADTTGISSFIDQRAEFKFAGRVAKSVAGAADVTLNRAEVGVAIIELTGVLTGNISVILPATKREWVVFNNTTGAFTIQLKVAGQTGIPIQQGGRKVVYGDGVDIRDATTSLTNPGNTSQALVDGANIAWDTSKGGAASVTLGGNRTVDAPTNLKAGGHYVLTVTQDGTGGRTLTWNAAFKGASGAAMTQPALAISAVTSFVFESDGTSLFLTGGGQYRLRHEPGWDRLRHARWQPHDERADEYEARHLHPARDPGRNRHAPSDLERGVQVAERSRADALYRHQQARCFRLRVRWHEPVCTGL